MTFKYSRQYHECWGAESTSWDIIKIRCAIASWLLHNDSQAFLFFQSPSVIILFATSSPVCIQSHAYYYKHHCAIYIILMIVFVPTRIWMITYTFNIFDMVWSSDTLVNIYMRVSHSLLIIAMRIHNVIKLALFTILE